MKLKFSRSSLVPLKLFSLSVAAGVAMALPFTFYRAGWLVLVCFLPFLFLLKCLEAKELKRRTKVAYIWLSGWIAALGVVFWLLQTQPERWSGLQGWTATGGLLLTYFIISLMLSLGPLIFGILYVWSNFRLSQKRAFLLLPAAWVVGEWARSWLFSIISVGPNTTFGPFWNFGSFGFALSATPLVQAGRLVGLFGLSFIVIVVNLAIWWLLQKRWKLPLLVLGFVILISVGGWLIYKQPTGSQVNVAALQLGVNENLEIGSIDFQDQLKALAQPGSVDVLVLSEYSDVFSNEENRATDTDAIQTIVKNPNAVVITSRQRMNDTKLHNTLTVYKPDSEVVYEHDKQFLIPVGEAMPYVYIHLFSLLGQKKVIDEGQHTREITKGGSPAEVYSQGGIGLGSMACSGAIAPELNRELAGQGAEVLTNSASLSIFASAPTYHQQAEQMARFIAVSNARPYIQATDGSFSYIIDSNGGWVARSGQKNIELLRSTVTTNKQKTLYTFLGEWVVGVSIIVLLVNVGLIAKHKWFDKSSLK